MLKGLSLTQKVTRLRGKPGTSVTVAVERKGAPKPLIITLTRAPLRPLPPLQKK
jgi:carboxyl-terminal processing protease